MVNGPLATTHLLLLPGTKAQLPMMVPPVSTVLVLS
jgi:hypothetical protein